VRTTLRTLAGTAALVAAVAAPDADARPHRAPLPPPAATAALPRALAADETEWRIRLSRLEVAAGTVTFNVYNRGMDDHDLVVLGRPERVEVLAGGRATLRVRLTPGRYRVVCSLFRGTPQSHEALGMAATLTVR
jgi:plastocyanin